MIEEKKGMKLLGQEWVIKYMLKWIAHFLMMDDKFHSRF